MKKLSEEINNSKLKILICCHKPCELPFDPDGFFLPIQVGAAISDVDLKIQRDDQVNGQPCDNISAKNKSFCELTAVYWAWKNIKKLYPDLKYIGINHYRRYFSFDKKNYFDSAIRKNECEIKNYSLNKNKMMHILRKNGVVVSRKKNYPWSLFVDYCICHISDDMRILQRVIHGVCPEYDRSFYNIILNGNKLSPYNMTVMDIGKFESYCEWLFRILSQVEKQVNISSYNQIQMRVFGYMAERLFNVWLDYNESDIKFLNIYEFCGNKNAPVKNFIHALHNSLSFFMLRSPIPFSSKRYQCIIAGN